MSAPCTCIPPRTIGPGAIHTTGCRADLTRTDPPTQRHPMRELHQVIAEDNRLARIKLAEKWCSAWLTAASAVIHNRPTPLVNPSGLPSEQEQAERVGALQRLAIEVALNCAVQVPGKAPGTTELTVVAFRSEPNE